MRIERKMLRAAGTAALGDFTAAVAMVSAAPAQAGQPASMVVGRGRVVIHLPAPAPDGPDRYVFLVDGVNQCTPTCGGLPVAKFLLNCAM